MAFGHGNTRTHFTALRQYRLHTPFVISGATNREFFVCQVETQLVPPLKFGDLIVSDDLSSIEAAPRRPRPCSRSVPDFSRPEDSISIPSIGFGQAQGLIWKVAARTYDELWRAVGHVCDLLTDEVCQHFFKAAGYASN
jgi:hypothetical protein